MIKNIIFDIGGVLLEYRWMDMLCEDHGMDKERACGFGNRMFNDQLWVQMDLGTITLKDAIKQYCDKYPDYADDIKWFLNNAEKMRINRTSIWDKMLLLKNKGYKIYVLSNYSKDLLDIHTGDSYFWKYVDGSVVSYQIHEIKPHKQIYQYLLNKYSLIASESLFFDDREENTAGAVENGLKAITVTSEGQLAKEIDRLLE